MILIPDRLRVRAALFAQFLLAALSTLCFSAYPSDMTKTFPVGEGGRLFAGPDVEALLARPYRIDVPMACAGQCLWAAHPTGWAFPPGSVHWYLLTTKSLGIDLRLHANDKPIAPTEGIAYPSHVRLTADGPVTIDGAKWITSDDMLVSRLTLTNTGATPVEVNVSAAFPVDRIDGRKDTFDWSFEHAEVTVHAIAALPGFMAAPVESLKITAYSKEGESPDSQSGSRGLDTKAAASGGAVLGSNFGADNGANATWTIDVPERMENAVLTIRYARGMEGNANGAVKLPGQQRMMQRMFPPTGGWGETPNEFGTQTFKIGPLDAGPAKISLYLLAPNSNVNIDALYIHDANSPPPGVTFAGAVATRAVRLDPGKSETLTCALAVATKRENAEAALKRLGTLADPLRDQVESYNRWNVANVPAFASMDDELTKQYWHRATSILRKNLFKVNEGRLQDWGISEGRWTASWYSNIISYGAGHQIREARWLRNPQYVDGIITTWCANEKQNGVFPNFIRPNTIGDGQYTDWITSTVWDAHCVHPNTAKLKEWANALKRNVDGWLATYDTDDDGLLLVDSHWWTGMEWQPSFFYFKNYDKDKQDQQLERVDLTAYVYGNAANLAKILSAIGDKTGAEKYTQIASKIRSAVESVMWDPASSYFYSVAPDTGEKAMVKEVIGVYPFYFSMFGPEHGKPYLAAWHSILDPNEFWTTWPVASASKKCPAYSQDVNFNGKRVGGCMWNGPTWPHANSLVMSAMAATLREFPESPLSTDKLFELFRSFTKAQFKAQDENFPWTGEYYNGDTAEWRTEQRDYNHSTYIDILIADIAGLRPRADNIIELHPLIGTQVPPFILDGIRYHDHNISILWSPKESAETQTDGLHGFRVYIDGKLAHHDPNKASHVEIGTKK